MPLWLSASTDDWFEAALLSIADCVVRMTGMQPNGPDLGAVTHLGRGTLDVVVARLRCRRAGHSFPGRPATSPTPAGDFSSRHQVPLHARWCNKTQNYATQAIPEETANREGISSHPEKFSKSIYRISKKLTFRYTIATGDNSSQTTVFSLTEH